MPVAIICYIDHDGVLLPDIFSFTLLHIIKMQYEHNMKKWGRMFDELFFILFCIQLQLCILFERRQKRNADAIFMQLKLHFPTLFDRSEIVA